MIESNRLKQAVAKLQRQMPSALEGGDGSGGHMTPVVGSEFPVPTPLKPATAPSAVSQIRNGEINHSVDTWFNPPPGSPLADVGKEAAFWFSNTVPVAGQILSFIDARTAAANDTLKSYTPAHSTYSPTRCDWDRLTGEARFQGTATLDAPLPNNRIVTPNRKVEYLGALIARRNSTIVAPFDCHLFCGIWDNTNSAPRPGWVKGTPFVIAATVRGGVPATTTERRYKVFAFTDRGYTFLSAEFPLVGAPSDAEFATHDVYLTWKPIPGILQYHVYRYDVVAGKYRLLKRIGSGNANYGDNNRIEDPDTAYPAFTNSTPIAYVATREHELDSVAVDGQPWTPLVLAPAVPDDYDVGTTTAEQVLRLGCTKALDRMMIDGSTVAGTPTVQSATGDFTALDTGRTATLFDVNGNVLHGPEVITYVSAAKVDFATNVVTTHADAVLYIVGGGDHGLLIDAIHVSYVEGAAFAAYPDDLNRLANGGQNPIAAPNHSSQGGAGGAGGVDPGEGGIGCITLDCPVNVWVGNTLESWPWKAVKLGEYLFSGDLRASRVLAKPRPASGQTDNLHLLRVRATWLYDIELPCSPAQPVITERLDATGRAVEHLTPRGYALITIDGHIKRKKIREIVATGKEAETGIFTLSPSHFFSAGDIRYRTPIHRLIGRILNKFRREPVVGVMLHNVKPSQ